MNISSINSNIGYYSAHKAYENKENISFGTEKKALGPLSKRVLRDLIEKIEEQHYIASEINGDANRLPRLKRKLSGNKKTNNEGSVENAFDEYRRHCHENG